MHITIGVTTDPINKLEKKFNLGYGPFYLEGTLRNEQDIEDPVVTITGTYTQGDLPFIPKCNYLYIQEWNRYYFIRDCKCVRDQVWQLTCHVDVLMSFKSDILNLTAVISKQQGSEYSSKNFNDGSYMTLEENFTEVSEFPTGLNNSGEFILMTAGRIQTSSGGGGSSEF